MRMCVPRLSTISAAAGVAALLGGCVDPDFRQIEDRAAEHRAQIEVSGPGCRGVEEILAQRSPVGCVPGGVVEGADARRLLDELRRMAAEPLDPAERVCAGISGQRSGTSLGWNLGLDLEERGLLAIERGEASRQERAEAAMCAAWAPTPMQGIEAHLWELSHFALSDRDDELAAAWLALDDRVARVMSGGDLDALSPSPEESPRLHVNLASVIIRAEDVAILRDRVLGPSPQLDARPTETPER